MMRQLAALLPFLALLSLPLLTACSTASAPPPRMSERALLRSAAPPRPVTPNIALQHDYYALGDSLFLFLRFEDSRKILNVQRAVSRLDYTIRAGSTERDAALLRDSVMVSAAKGVPDDGILHLQLKVPVKQVANPHVLQLRLAYKPSGQERATAVYQLPLAPDMLDKSYLVTRGNSGQPLFQHYITENEPLVIKHFKEGQPAKVLYYGADFMPALPPMSTRQEPLLSLLKPTDSVTYAATDTIRLKNAGLYLLKSADEPIAGITVQPGSFPLVTKAKELLDPLIYLTTSEEREYLLKTKDPKATVDEFWIKLAPNNEVARSLIKTFYSRVEEANRLYTCHKAGWATDRGMIYVVFGPPNSISRVGNTETWVYRETEATPYVKFVFNKKENTFTQNYYELIRHRDYGESWYSTVARWRAGIAET